MNNYPALIVIAPLLAALFAGLAVWIEDRLSYYIAILGLAVSSFSALKVLIQVIESGTIQYKMAGWDAPVGIEYRIDLLNAMVLLLISGIALFNLIASYKNVEQEISDRKGSFYTIYLLFVTGLLGVTATGDLFNLYVLIEITSLTSYAMVALSDKDRGPLASLNYIFIGVIGASFYLLGVGYLYMKTGSLNMMDVADIIASQHDSSTVLVGFILCMIGVWIKMALFPMHVWLPNAYSYSPVAFSRVVAPLMTKVMVYVMIRLMITVFGFEYIFNTLHLSEAVVWLATIAVLAGGVLALAQDNLKKILAYIIVCEIGYMVGGAWLGNQSGMTGAILHLLNDALMTFALFLGLGNMVYMLGKVKLNNLQGLFSRMPWTMTGFVVAAFSIVGVPPTCGFFSKWYLISGAFEAGAYHFAAALIISSLICAILFFKVFEICFFQSSPDLQGQGHGHKFQVMAEAPVSMLIVSNLVSFSLIVVGVFSGTIVKTIILPFLQGI
ncbi:MAG: monovalent cation/H+ antiporter subunit D family protein [Proteobacteria bacterium]|nr:monovalent cation/H+ antiporter subunit D family protein [Pseudomonadota bacterium]MBU1386601.1 monovalent cation/H+ antiporter subunit D family protein [Pseudomonadota bacterium]MBU1542502.1 monovalent cation/H+ antiporter subunit D family protein [Pseudomonadota bacterium]MBU2481532.1 monovalent cation/H+ antiporter subunit D family protein [Pseudomonadota bacterium]